MSLLGGHLGARASALLDGALSAEETERAWAHVQDCHLCRDAVEREAWLKRRLAGLGVDPAVAAPDALKGSLLCGPRVAPGDLMMAYEQPRGRRTVALAALGGGAVGAVVMGLLAFGAAPADAPTYERHTPFTAVNTPTTVSVVHHARARR